MVRSLRSAYLVVLIAGMLIASSLPASVAQTEKAPEHAPSPDVALELLKMLNRTAEYTASLLSNDTPDYALQLYSNASALGEKAVKLYEEGNYTGATTLPSLQCTPTGPSSSSSALRKPRGRVRL